tara:strand:- start:142 stop:549 length:408 start_codon:yes stop_codon:yes gene_type:complete
MPPFVSKIANDFLTNPMMINTTSSIGKKPAIQQIYYDISKMPKYQLLCLIMDDLDDFYGFIFCNTKRDVDALSEKLMKEGYACESMHGDLSQAQRERALRKFKSKQCRILVVTDVAARGIDVKDISCVINYSVPQ